ncbi:MAG: PIG-L family deacetylase [Phycisphaerales bacterium]|nr:PIG-L family deacetylase [Phycisphaerales bacterium]
MNVLVVGPHPDDQEIGMGGTIARLAQAGHDVLLLDVTDGSPTPRGDRATRLAEAQVALACLQPGAGGRPIRRVLLDLKNREVEPTLAARHAVAGVIRAHRAQVVFVPHWEDAHPDHRAVTRIVEDARFDAKLTKIDMPVPPGLTPGPPLYPKWVFYYEISHLRRLVHPTFCFDITGFEGKKLSSIGAYRSQFGPWDEGGPGVDPGKVVSTDFRERVLAHARVCGSLIGVPFAEAFTAKEPLAVSDFSTLS